MFFMASASWLQYSSLSPHEMWKVITDGRSVLDVHASWRLALLPDPRPGSALILILSIGTISMLFVVVRAKNDEVSTQFTLLCKN